MRTVDARTTLGFRSLYRTHDTPDLIDIASGRLVRWLETKKYSPELLKEGGPTEIGDGVWASLQRLDDAESGSQTLRARVVEQQKRGRWTTEMTVQNSARGTRGWVWLDVHKPDQGWTNTPRLSRMLVAALPARDGAQPLRTRLKLVCQHEVDDVVKALSDPGRRGLAFVAGSSGRKRPAEWFDEVEDLLDDTVGLANGWVLTQEATERFNLLAKADHAVRPGFLRTYAPNVSWGDPLDANRHRFLTSATIERVAMPALRKVLGQRAREQMISTRLPDYLRDLDRLLRRESDEALLDDLRPERITQTAAAQPMPVTDRASTTVRSPGSPPLQRIAPKFAPEKVRPEPPEPRTAPVEPKSPPETLRPMPAEPQAAPELAEHILTLIKELLDSDEVSIANIDRIGQMARASRQAPERISRRLEQLRDSVEEAEFERDLAREELAVEQRERADAEEERADAQRRLRYFQKELASLGRPDAAWGEADVDIRDIRPDSFIDLMSRLADLTHVVFTGDTQTMLDLDRHGNSRSWAGKSWDALLALDDYARVRIEDNYEGDIARYIAEPPAGCRGFSLARHAVGESESVRQHPRLRKHRELPVPTEFEASGVVFMGAHFKIAQSAMISPRLHYADGTAALGRIYVGYIGPHLPTGES